MHSLLSKFVRVFTALREARQSKGVRVNAHERHTVSKNHQLLSKVYIYIYIFFFFLSKLGARESQLKFFLTMKLMETKTNRQKCCEVKAITSLNENKISLTN